jgi:hypothetical protein
MIPSLAKATVQVSGLSLVLFFTAGCASYWVRYDKQLASFREGAPQFDKTGNELAAGKIPCRGGLDIVREHGLLWWPGGFYRHDLNYGIYFKQSGESSRNFYFTMPRQDGWPQVAEARGEVVVADRSVSIKIEYQDNRGKWRMPPINGTHEINWVLPDDRTVPQQ